MKNYVVKSAIYPDSTICADGFDIENGDLNFYIDNHHIGSFRDWINVTEESPTQSPLILGYELRIKEKNVEIEAMLDANKSMAESLIEKVKEEHENDRECERLMNKVKNLEKRLDKREICCGDTVFDPRCLEHRICTLPPTHTGPHSTGTGHNWF